MSGAPDIGERLPIDGDGTDEATWAAWPLLDGLAALALTGVTDPLVVAPHPDDEVLGAGGLLRRLGGTVVAVTDGDASHPGSTVHSPAELAELRRAETEAALVALGRPRTPVVRLGHPDGGVEEHRLTGQLTELLRPGRWCVATWRGDGHPDHEATGRAAAAACAATGAVLVEYPVWTWHWARPGQQVVPWQRMRRLELEPADRSAKAAAIACFRTQIRPIGPAAADAAVLSPGFLARFARAYETFIVGSA